MPWWICSVMVTPTEYDSHRQHLASQAADGGVVARIAGQPSRDGLAAAASTMADAAINGWCPNVFSQVAAAAWFSE